MGVWLLKQHNNNRHCSPLASQSFVTKHTHLLLLLMFLIFRFSFFLCSPFLFWLWMPMVATFGMTVEVQQFSQFWQFLQSSTESCTALATGAATTRTVLLLLLLLWLLQQLDGSWLRQLLCCWMIGVLTLFWLLTWQWFVLLSYLFLGLTVGVQYLIFSMKLTSWEGWVKTWAKKLEGTLCYRASARNVEVLN